MIVELRGGVVLTMEDRAARATSVFVDGGRIVAVGDGAELAKTGAVEVVDVSGCVVMPGFVQAHTHVCQTLCRGSADDLPLLEWLRRRVWPYEAALDERAMRASARVAAAELLLGGTTAILDMGTVHETDALGDELGRSGLRAVIGKALMDDGEGVPRGLHETTRAALDDADALAQRFAGAFEGRLGWAYAPRFVLSCTEALLREVVERQRRGARVHTHASEQRAEVELVRARLGDDNVAWLDGIGMGGPQVVLAHCVHVTPAEVRTLAASGTHVAHCPSSNLKLASGIAPLPSLLEAGINVALGADGAPCNNGLDALQELRLAALLHKPAFGAEAIGAWTALELATKNGAAALGLASEIGSITVGRKADLVVLDLDRPHIAPSPDPASAVVYSARAGDVRDVMVDGRWLVRDRQLTAATGLDAREVTARAREEQRRVMSRMER